MTVDQFGHFYLDLSATKWPSKRVNLVQRLEHRTHNREGFSGVDQHFACEYMGSAEFEWGALPQSLKRMREAKYGKLKPVLIKIKAHEVNNPHASEFKEFKAYYLGPEGFLDRIREFFRLELEGFDGPTKPRFKEVTYIDRAYGLEQRSTWSCRTIGWWDIGNDWLLFKSETDANKFRDELKPPTVKERIKGVLKKKKKK